MEFCPECGTILMPQEKGKHTWLVCGNCGRYKKLKEEEYKFGEEREDDTKSGIVVIEKEKNLKIKEPDYDLDTDACAEMYEEGY